MGIKNIFRTRGVSDLWEVTSLTNSARPNIFCRVILKMQGNFYHSVSRFIFFISIFLPTILIFKKWSWECDEDKNSLDSWSGFESLLGHKNLWFHWHLSEIPMAPMAQYCTVGRTTGFWSTRYGFESQQSPIFFCFIETILSFLGLFLQSKLLVFAYFQSVI